MASKSSRSSSTKQLGLQTINFNYHNRKNDNRKIQLDREKIRIWLKSEEYIQSQKRKSRSKHWVCDVRNCTKKLLAWRNCENRGWFNTKVKQIMNEIYS